MNDPRVKRKEAIKSTEQRERYELVNCDKRSTRDYLVSSLPSSRSVRSEHSRIYTTVS